MKIKYRILSILFLSIIVVSSCFQEVKKPSWNVDVMAPLFNASITIEEMIPDSFLSIGEDSLISFVYENEIFNFNLDSFISMPDTSYRYAVYLDSIQLGTISIAETVTLGDIITNAGLGMFIQDGSNYTIPPLSGLSSDDIIIDASEYFQTMTLTEGFLDVTIENQLPIDITNLIFEMVNSDGGEVIVLDTFLIIESGTSQTKTVLLDGKTIKGNLVGKILNMDSPGSNGNVLIDYADALITTIVVYDLVPNQATAIFPTQNLLDKGDKIYLELNSIQLYDMVARQGILSIDAYNTIEDPVYFTYTLPGLTINGDTFSVSGIIDAASNGEASVLHMTHDVSGYNLDLRGAGPIERLYNEDLNNNGIIDEDTVNTIFVLAVAGIDSTGHLISLSLQDSFIFESSLTELIPEYGTGFLGKDTFPGIGTSELDIFDKLNNANISLEDAILSLEVSNQIGIEGGLFVNNITATNSETGQSTTLQITGIDNPFIFSKPTDPFSINIPVDPVIKTFTLNNSNSNARELIELLPNVLSHSIEFYLNYNNNIPPFGTGTDFIYYDSELKAKLNLEIPLSLSASNIVLSDTIPFSISEEAIQNINSGDLYLIVENSFPLTVEINLILLDQLSNEIGILNIENHVLPGIIDAEANKVLHPETSRLKIKLNTQDWDNLLDSHFIHIVARFNTSPQTEHVKIYSSYALDVVLTANVNYHVE